MCGFINATNHHIDKRGLIYRPRLFFVGAPPQSLCAYIPNLGEQWLEGHKKREELCSSLLLLYPEPGSNRHRGEPIGV